MTSYTLALNQPDHQSLSDVRIQLIDKGCDERLLGRGRPSGLTIIGQFTLQGLPVTARTFSVVEILGGTFF